MIYAHIFSSLWWGNWYVRNQLVSVTSWPCCWESDDSEDYHHCIFLKMRKGNGHVLKKSWWDQTWHTGDLQSYKQVAGLSQGPVKGKMHVKRMLTHPGWRSAFLLLLAPVLALLLPAVNNITELLAFKVCLRHHQGGCWWCLWEKVPWGLMSVTKKQTNREVFFHYR